MNTILSLLAVFAVAAALAPAPLAAREEGERLRITTTIDFLDYVFDDQLAKAIDHYPLEIYERRIRELAEHGVDKIQIRVNVCGVTLYPTKVGVRYGDGGRYHWWRQDQAKRNEGHVD